MLSVRLWLGSLASPFSSPFPPQRCELCLKPGATVGCCLSSCLSNFHFMCARASYCIFQDDKKVFCQKHTDLLDGKVGPHPGGDSSPLHSLPLPLRELRSPSGLAPAASQCLFLVPLPSAPSPLVKPLTDQSLPPEPSLTYPSPATNPATPFATPLPGDRDP